MSERNFIVGDKVIYYRDPSDHDWVGVGKISHGLHIGDNCEITKIYGVGSSSIEVRCQGNTWGWLPKEVFKLVEMPHTVLKGQYVVTLTGKFKDETNCGKENYCFKQRSTEDYMCPEIDVEGSRGNGRTGVSFDNKGLLTSWRFATEAEIKRYDELGKPYDVTTYEILYTGELEDSKLVEGKTYRLRDDYIFISGGGKSTNCYINIHDESFHTGGFFGSSFGYFDATPEQTNWILACKQENCFVELEDVTETLSGISKEPLKKVTKTLSGIGKELLKKANKKYPIGTRYISVDKDGEGEKHKVTIKPELFDCPSGKYCVIGAYGGGLLYHHNSDTWAEIIEDAPEFKVGDYVTVLDTPNVRKYNNGKAIGFTFQIEDEDDDELESFLEGGSIALDPDNTHGTNYELGDIRLATSEEIAKSKFKYKFSVGDSVVVSGWGQGIGSDNKGKSCTITELGEYVEGPGYKIDPPMGNTLTGSHEGFIGEDMFSKSLKAPKEPSLKIRDWVEIVNLRRDDLGTGELSGIIGHKGKIVSQDRDGMYRLDPTCVGACWYAHNLRKVKEPVKTYVSDMDSILKDSHKLGMVQMYPQGVAMGHMAEALEQMYRQFPITPMSWEIDLGTKPSPGYSVKPIIIPVKKI